MEEFYRLCKCDRPTQCYKGVGGIYCRMFLLEALIDWFSGWLSVTNDSFKSVEKEK
jgi:hypothetical protein